MNLSAPTKIFFLISVVLTVIAVLGFLGVIGLAGMGVPSFWVAFAGWAVLAAGCMFKGA